MRDIEINTVTFYEEGVTISYGVRSTDLYENGVSQTHTLFLPRDEYAPVVTDLESSAEAAIREALEDMISMRREGSEK